MFTVSPQTDMFRGALGGTILGLSATGLMLLNGHITGVSGIFNKFIADEHRGWRAWYVAGLGSAGLALRLLLGSETTLGPSGGDSGLKPAAAIVAGALVGFGTALSGGCTTGHGVCGLARLSPRSLTAVLSFVGAGMVSVWATKGFLKPYVYGSATDGTLAKIMPYVTAGVLIAALFGPALHRALSLEVKTRDDDGEITLDAEHKPVKHTSSEGSVASGLADFSAGAMLGLGLGVSGMVNLQKVQSFLEVTRIPSGTWDPTLMAVLLSAVGVNLASFQIMSRMRSPPLLAPAGSPPLSKHLLMGPVGSNKKIDWKLIVGAAMFGLGWGAGGVCPGPSILALAGGGVTAMYVVPGMVLGLELKNFLIGE